MYKNVITITTLPTTFQHVYDQSIFTTKTFRSDREILEISFEHDILQHQVGLTGIEAISFQIKNKGSITSCTKHQYNLVSLHLGFPNLSLLGRENLPFFL